MALKTLSSTGIANNNPILPGQVTQSVNAFTGAEGYAITVSGSFTFTGATTGSGVFSNAVTAVTSTNASKLNPTLINTTNKEYNVLFADTSSAAYEQIGKEDGNIMTYNPSTDLLTVTSSYTISSSRAISSSYSDNATVSQVNTQQYYNGVSVVNGDFKFVAGVAAMSNSSATSSIFTNLAGKTLGTNAWINANFYGAVSTNEGITVTSISSSGEVLFECAPPSNINNTIIFTGIYI